MPSNADILFLIIKEIIYDKLLTLFFYNLFHSLRSSSMKNYYYNGENANVIVYCTLLIFKKFSTEYEGI